MPWQDTALLLLEQLRALKSDPYHLPHGWVRRADYASFNALRNLHRLLNLRLPQPPSQQGADAWAKNSPPLLPDCTHPKPNYAWPHAFPGYIGGLYNTPTIADLANQLALELPVVIAPADQPLGQDVLSFVRDAADCD